MTTRNTILLVALVATMQPACHGKRQARETPRQGYRAFVAAVESGESKRIWSRLGPRTKRHLEAWARWTNDKADLDLAPRELFLVDFPKMLPKEVRVLRQDDRQALVTPADPPSHKLELLADGWLVRLKPLDSMPVTKRSGQVVLGPLGLRISATRKTTTQENFLMVRDGNRWLVELPLPPAKNTKNATRSDSADTQGL